MRKKILTLVLLLCSVSVMAQERKPINISAEARGDFRHHVMDGNVLKGESGFKGYILNFIMNGEISPKFSYAYRQRFNAINQDASFFDSVDMLSLTYLPTNNFKLTVGKTAVYVGGQEMDIAPIDCFILSSYCYHLACYQWGVSVGYISSSNNDKVTFQVCQSPFEEMYSKASGMSANMFAYNLIWHGKHGFIDPICSVNMMEYAPSRYINYIVLGARFHLGSQVQFDLDLKNRAASGQRFIGDDYTISGQVSYQPIEKLNLFAKGTYDVNKSGTEANLIVPDGTDIGRVGVGVEYFPLKDKSVRIHGYYSYSFGTNTFPDPFLRDKVSMVNVGATWRVKIL